MDTHNPAPDAPPPIWPPPERRSHRRWVPRVVLVVSYLWGGLIGLFWAMSIIVMDACSSRACENAMARIWMAWGAFLLAAGVGSAVYGARRRRPVVGSAVWLALSLASLLVAMALYEAVPTS